MIVSFTHNFIYFRPKKTGSSTIVEVLRPSLGDGDISRGKEIPEHPEVHGRTHLTAAEIEKIVPAEFWRHAFKFASERHPYEKAVSLAYFRLGKQQERRGRFAPHRFSALLEQTVAGDEYCGFRYYNIGGRPIVDEFIRHESLDADLQRVAARLGVPVPEQLPQKKSTYRKDKRPAREILSPEQKHVIFEKCRREFELLGYEP